MPDGTTPRGYLASDFADACARYLPAPSTSATSATSATPLASHVADVADVAATGGDGGDARAAGGITWAEPSLPFDEVPIPDDITVDGDRGRWTL
jgi:hypothetical protein